MKMIDGATRAFARCPQRAYSNHTQGLAVCPALAVLVIAGALLPGARAMAQADLVELSSDAGFSSALYNEGPAHSEVIAHSLAAWDAMGRQGQSDTGRLPATSIFEQDLAQGWSQFAQAGAGGSLHSFAQAGGYYMNSGGGTFASTGVAIRNRVHVVNNGASVSLVSAAYATHGYLLSGGIANCITAFAQETAIITAHTGFGDFQWGWSGGASVFATDIDPTVNSSGDWTNAISPVTRAVQGFVDPFKGVELSLLGATDLIPMLPHETIDIDLDFQGFYSATSSPTATGFLSLGLADFSGSGSISYSAVDATTGLPTNDVSFELVGVPAPGGALLGFMMLATVGAKRARRA